MEDWSDGVMEYWNDGDRMLSACLPIGRKRNPAFAEIE